MCCKTPCTVTNVLKKPWFQEAATVSALGIRERKDGVLVSPALAPCTSRVTESIDSLSPCVDCKRYRLYGVRDDIAVIAGHHNYFLITYVTNDEVVSRMRSSWVYKPPKTSPTFGKFNDDFWLSWDGLFGEAGRINVDVVRVGNEQKVPIPRQCGLVVEVSPEDDNVGFPWPTRLLRNLATKGITGFSLLLKISLG